MLIKREILNGILEGKISLAFRRWKRPTVKSGGRLRTALGELYVKSVTETSIDAISNRDAKRAGFAVKEDLIRELHTSREGSVYRIELEYARPDTRIALRDDENPDAATLASLAEKLSMIDARSRYGAWTHAYLMLIEKHPALRATELAEHAGHETIVLKRNVRKLKELGLTESLSPGYQLSPRGKTLLKHFKQQTKKVSK